MAENTSHGPRVPKVVVMAVLSVLGLGLGLYLGALAINDIAWSDTGERFRALGPVSLLIAVGLTIVAGYLRGIRWKILFHPRPVSAFRLYLIEQTGTAMDTFSAVHLLDEVVETAILSRRDRIPTGAVLATLAMQRTLEFGATVLILGTLALFLEPLREIRTQLAWGMGGAVLAIGLLYTIGPNLIRAPFINRLGVAVKFAETVVLMRRNWQRTGAAFALSIIQSLMVGTAGWMLADSLGVPLDIFEATAITMGVMLFGSIVPGLPLAVGTYEFAAVAMFEFMDRSAAEAISFSLLLRVNIYLLPLIMAGIFLSREGLVSLGHVLSLVRNHGAESQLAAESVEARE